jgi:hypothetical protein
MFAVARGAPRPGIRGHVGEACSEPQGGAEQRRPVVVRDAPRCRPNEYRPFTLCFLYFRICPDSGARRQGVGVDAPTSRKDLGLTASGTTRSRAELAWQAEELGLVLRS